MTVRFMLLTIGIYQHRSVSKLLVKIKGFSFSHYILLHKSLGGLAMKPISVNKLVAAALMAAMTCAATIVIAIPSPMGGFIHPGDGLVIISGIILGPFFGGLAAGIGSMIADLVLGYSAYAPATLIIKGLAAILNVCIYRILSKNIKIKVIPILTASMIGGILVTSGYFLFESTLLGLGLASASINIPFNLIQNGFGVIISVLLLPLLLKVPQIKSLIED
jgi:uncharacterized membrane protein